MRFWIWAHKWSSLICTAFLLVLCVTGLPLIFRGEIDHALGYGAGGQATARPAPLAAIEAAAQVARPLGKIHFLVWEPDKPGVITLSIAPPGAKSFFENENVLVDAATASPPSGGDRASPTQWLIDLHGTLLLGPMGPLVLGVPAVLFIVALVSGIVIYGPFARKAGFARVRVGRTKRTAWLDLHNMLGAVIMAWMLVVGATGLINTWGASIIQFWQMSELSTYAQRGSPPTGKTASIDAIVAAGRARFPDYQPYFVAYPGSLMAGERFHALYLRGPDGLKEHIFQPVLVDSVTARVIGAPRPPWYISALALSQPLHFGDYGGMLLKIMWALLDLATIAVLISGLKLTFSKGGKRPRDIGPEVPA
ncbi:PepSY-associated TM helix domain-containing protein [Caulobacter segnis]|uniref:PepSY-associated TM helix domain-containing protein n=1 Tax=Caulobacter segnis TaxID=88688 RepID=UPI0028627754|nr:PepSY-associated TM helix domain-containing protein [Caulobacter segnis]MDR6623836.1 putative iron-regulated membrane protein [Caulobacter segnis]